MAGLRVFELARELNLKNNVLIKEMTSIGYNVISHMTILDGNTCEIIRKKFNQFSINNSIRIEDPLEKSQSSLPPDSDKAKVPGKIQGSNSESLPTVDFRVKLNAAIRNAKIEIVGEDDVKNESQANVLIAIIKAFGDSPAGFIYVEPCTTRSTKRPPDILLCHPKVGVLIIEVKGFRIYQIEDIKAGNIYKKTNGVIKPYNPYRQAQDSMFDISDAVRRKIRARQKEPLFNSMVALPDISYIDLKERNYANLLPNDELLLRDEIEDINKLKQKILTLVKNTLNEARKREPLLFEQVNIIKEVFGDSAALKDKRNSRKDIPEDMLGAIIDELACLDKNLSIEQKELSRIAIKGFPRLIRGVAGSGKTIVLSNIVARYFNRCNNSDGLFKQYNYSPKVAVICFNRALVPLLKEKIFNSYHEQTYNIIEEGKIEIIHLMSFLFHLCDGTPLRYLSYKVGDPSYRANKYIEGLEKLKITDIEMYNSLLFDAIFIDEGQDIEPEEYKLLLMLIKEDKYTNEKNLIIFYDDAQNLYTRKRPVWKDIGIDLGKGDRSRIMKECFRNTKEVIELGFNVLIGKQAPDSEAVKNRTYADIKTLKQNDMIEENDEFINIKFTERTFHKPLIKIFKSREEEIQSLTSEVINLIYEHNVRPEDILILFNSESEFKNIDKMIMDKDVNKKIEGFIKPFGDYSDKDDYIFKKKYITISTVYGAKGYDAYIVFILGVDAISTDERGRALFYVGSTRSKLGLCISGIENSNHNLLTEAMKVNNILPQ